MSGTECTTGYTASSLPGFEPVLLDSHMLPNLGADVYVTLDARPAVVVNGVAQSYYLIVKMGSNTLCTAYFHTGSTTLLTAIDQQVHYYAPTYTKFITEAAANTDFDCLPWPPPPGFPPAPPPPSPAPPPPSLAPTALALATAAVAVTTTAVALAASALATPPSPPPPSAPVPRFNEVCTPASRTSGSFACRTDSCNPYDAGDGSCGGGNVAGGSSSTHFTLYQNDQNGNGNGKTPAQCRTECYHDDDCLAFEIGPRDRCEIWTNADGSGGGTVKVGHTTNTIYACYIKLTHIAGSGLQEPDYPDCND